MASIVILEHALQRHMQLPHMVKLFSGRWREQGHTVVFHRGLENPPPADLAVLHLDVTVVPQAYRALAARYARVINGAVFDISKSCISRDLVRPDTAWNGPVIVKTETNYGGKPEHLLRSIAAATGEPCDIPAGPVAEGYPIYRSLQAVPETVWRTPGFVAEKFLPEQDALGYYLRVWTFFGNRERCVRWRAGEPIVKASNMVARELAAVPDAMRARRAELRFDFGKFDFVLHGGRWVLLDVSRTPSFPEDGPEAPRDAIRELGDGIESFLR